MGALVMEVMISQYIYLLDVRQWGASKEPLRVLVFLGPSLVEMKNPAFAGLVFHQSHGY
jgi:hypothetical protein